MFNGCKMTIASFEHTNQERGALYKIAIRPFTAQ